MARKFEAIPADTFGRLALGAGVLLSSFTPSANPTITTSNIICVTDGGVSITAVPEYADMADGLDNCPSNTKQLKHLKQYTVTLSGTGKTIDASMTKKLLGAGTSSTAVSGVTKIVPNAELSTSDFNTIWWVGDYGNTDGHFVAIKISNALSTGGFSLQSADGDKASFSFTFVGHYSVDATSTAPIEVYISEATASQASDT